MIARLGGDEFAVIEYVDQSGRGGGCACRADQEKRSASPSISATIRVTTGTSIGIAVAPRDGTDCDEILKSADLALYSAKSGGRGSFRFFEPELDQLMHARRNLERDMRSRLPTVNSNCTTSRFVNLKSGKISGFEALLRWHHPAARHGHAR